MQKRQQPKRTLRNHEKGQCIICQFGRTLNASMLVFPSKILANKYQYRPPHLHQSTLISSILGPQSSRAKVAFREAEQQSRHLEMLLDYRPFHTILTLIKPLVLQRTRTTSELPIHYGGKAYRVVMRRMLSLRMLGAGRPKFKKILAKNGSGTSTDEDFYCSPPNYGSVLPFGIAKRTPNAKAEAMGLGREPQLNIKAEGYLKGTKEQETPEIRRLTRNLSNMIRQFDDNWEFRPSLISELLEGLTEHVLDLTEIEKQRIFQEQIQGNISGIEGRPRPSDRVQTETVERLNTVPCQMEENYGLKGRTKGGVRSSRNIMPGNRDPFKVGSTHKSRSKMLKENLSPTQRVQTDYDCDIVQKQKRKSGSRPLSKGLKSAGSSSGKVSGVSGRLGSPMLRSRGKGLKSSSSRGKC